MKNYDSGGNFHTNTLIQLDTLCKIAVGLEKALEDFHRRGEDAIEENLDSVNKYIEQLRNPEETKGFTSIPYIYDLVEKVRKAYNL